MDSRSTPEHTLATCLRRDAPSLMPESAATLLDQSHAVQIFPQYRRRPRPDTTGYAAPDAPRTRSTTPVGNAYAETGWPHCHVKLVHTGPTPRPSGRFHPPCGHSAFTVCAASIAVLPVRPPHRCASVLLLVRKRSRRRPTVPRTEHVLALLQLIG